MFELEVKVDNFYACGELKLIYKDLPSKTESNHVLSVLGYFTDETGTYEVKAWKSTREFTYNGKKVILTKKEHVLLTCQLEMLQIFNSDMGYAII